MHFTIDGSNGMNERNATEEEEMRIWIFKRLINNYVGWQGSSLRKRGQRFSYKRPVWRVTLLRITALLHKDRPLLLHLTNLTTVSSNGIEARNLFPPSPQKIIASLRYHQHCYSPLSKRVENWGESGRALSYGIVWGRTRLKTNARAPPKRSQKSTRTHSRTRFPLFLKVGYWAPLSALPLPPPNSN